MKGLPLVIVLAIGVSLLLVVEGGLRLLLGLGKRPLYLADEKIGYLLAPNQKVRRLGKLTVINQYSMRSQGIEKARPKDTLRILLLGDSIANGAWWTDQSDTLAALIEKQLQTANASKAEVLNASANSWGPRNQLAYLRHFGTFEAQVVVLLLNTDDLFATAPTSLPVGRDRHYPDRQPFLALEDLLSRFFSHSQAIPGTKEKGDRVGINLQAISQIREISTQANAKFFLAITPLLREVDGSDPRKYESKAKERLRQFATTEAIALIDFLPQFQKTAQPNSLYRDHIHLSPLGNQLVSTTISQSLNKVYEVSEQEPR